MWQKYYGFKNVHSKVDTYIHMILLKICKTNSLGHKHILRLVKMGLVGRDLLRIEFLGNMSQ